MNINTVVRYLIFPEKRLTLEYLAVDIYLDGIVELKHKIVEEKQYCI